MDPPHLYLVRQRWQGLKDQDRNFVAAFFHMCTVALVCTSLAALGWFRLRGAPCSPHLAVFQFFSFGHFTMENSPSVPKIITSEAESSPFISQYHSSTGVISCVTPEVASLMRIIILLCFFVLASALSGFFLDIWGPARPTLQLLRRASLPSILTVLWVASIIGVCYNLTEDLRKTTAHITPAFDLRISFEYGIYTITAAGACAVAATASNLLQLSPTLTPTNSNGQDLQRIVDDWDGLESFSVAGYGDTPLDSIPPPLYTP